jgi:type II secretory pathway predicted ATPase ExeA
MLALKNLLQQHGISQAQLARDIDLSPALVAQLLNHEKWPASIDKTTLKGKITGALAVREIAVDAAMFEAVADTQPATFVTPNQESIDMLRQKKPLSQAARKHFGLFRDPFDDDVNDVEDVFLSPDIRNVREWLWGTAKFGGFGAVIGESGAGKSTLRLDLIDRINREHAPIIIIEPSTRRMEDTDKKGKTMKAGDIEDAIIYTLAPLETPKRSPEAKSRQLERLLIDSRRSGSSHCLIIEEAHGLPVPTLKHLKRFHEIRDGFKKLLSVVLIGQSELKLKLAGNAGDVREVSQRCEQIELAPLDAQLEDYLRFKFKRVGVDLESIFEKDALDGIRAQLILSKSHKNTRESVSLMYPLMVNNLVTVALNQAALLGFSKVSKDLILEV